MAKRTFNNRLWHQGVIGIPNKNGKMKAAEYWVKAYDEGSEYGIEEGRISKMEIRINGQTVCSYDRGWDIYPETEEDQWGQRINSWLSSTRKPPSGSVS